MIRSADTKHHYYRINACNINGSQWVKMGFFIVVTVQINETLLSKCYT